MRLGSKSKPSRPPTTTTVRLATIHDALMTDVLDQLQDLLRGLDQAP